MKKINKNKRLIIGFSISVLSLYALSANSVEIQKNQINDTNKTKLQVQKTYPNLKQVLPYQVLKSGEPSSGKLTIVNSTNQVKTSTIKLYFVLKNRLENNNIIEQSPITYASYNIPSFRKNTYRFENGPSMRVNKDTFVYLIADNNSTKMRVKEFLILK